MNIKQETFEDKIKQVQRYVESTIDARTALIDRYYELALMLEQLSRDRGVRIGDMQALESVVVDIRETSNDANDVELEKIAHKLDQMRRKEWAAANEVTD